MKKLLLVAAVMMGCGGSDGVSDSKKLSDLSASEAKSVCNDLASDYPERTVNCDGTTFTIGFSSADCTDAGTDPVDATCTATVGDARDCYDAIYSLSDAELCDPNTTQPAACDKLDGC